MKKKTSRKPAKRNRKAETVIKSIGELSSEEREKFDRWMAYILFHDTFSLKRDMLNRTISYGIEKNGQVFLGSLKGREPLSSSKQLVCILLDHLREFWRIWSLPGGTAEKARKFDNMWGVKQPDVNKEIDRLAEQGRSGSQIAIYLNDAGFKQNNGKPWKGATVRSNCSRRGIKLNGST